MSSSVAMKSCFSFLTVKRGTKNSRGTSELDATFDCSVTFMEKGNNAALHFPDFPVGDLQSPHSASLKRTLTGDEEIKLYLKKKEEKRAQKEQERLKEWSGCRQQSLDSRKSGCTANILRPISLADVWPIPMSSSAISPTISTRKSRNGRVVPKIKSGFLQRQNSPVGSDEDDPVVVEFKNSVKEYRAEMGTPTSGRAFILSSRDRAMRLGLGRLDRAVTEESTPPAERYSLPLNAAADIEAGKAGNEGVRHETGSLSQQTLNTGWEERLGGAEAEEHAEDGKGNGCQSAGTQDEGQVEEWEVMTANADSVGNCPEDMSLGWGEWDPPESPSSSGLGVAQMLPPVPPSPADEERRGFEKDWKGMPAVPPSDPVDLRKARLHVLSEQMVPPGTPHASPEEGLHRAPAGTLEGRLDEGETDGSRVPEGGGIFRAMLEPVGGRVRGEVVGDTESEWVGVSTASCGNGTFNRVSAWLEVMGGGEASDVVAQVRTGGGRRLPAHPQPTEAPSTGGYFRVPSNGSTSDEEEKCSVLSEWVRDATDTLAGDASSTGSAMEAAQESLAEATEGYRTGGMRGEVGGGGERDGMASAPSPLPGDSQGLSRFREGATAGRWAIRGEEGEVLRSVSAQPPVSSHHSPRWSAQNASWRCRREGTGAPVVRSLRG